MGRGGGGGGGVMILMVANMWWHFFPPVCQVQIQKFSFILVLGLGIIPGHTHTNVLSNQNI